MRPRLRFWGVRGSYPAPGACFAGYGGNTPCVEIAVPETAPLFLDAGTGIRGAGMALAQQPEGEAHIFFSHLHWDHIQGLPSFAPLFMPGWSVYFYSVRPADQLRTALESQFCEPYFPAGGALRAALHYRSITRAGVTLNRASVRPFPLRHPGGSAAYRVSAPGTAVVYASDHEHGCPDSDRNLRINAEGASLLIYDAQFTPEEYGSRAGWGHSTWREGGRAAREAGVQRLHLYHHDPRRTDAEVDALAAQAASEFPATTASREDCWLTL